MTNALMVQRVWKSYAAGVQGCSARVWALRGCTLQVAMGERVGIVGRRGAGKTTFMHCLAGHRPVDAGRIDTPLLSRCYLSSTFDLERLPDLPPPSRVLVLVDLAPQGTGGAAYETLLTAARVLAPITGALIIAGPDVATVAPLVDRVVLLQDGHLAELTRLPVRRVAERPPLAS